MQYIRVQFFGTSEQKYTYKCKRRVSLNDFVVVPTPTGNTVVKVVGLHINPPQYECKEVIKKVRL